MADWLARIGRGDVVRVSIARVTVDGQPSCVTRALFRLDLADGGVEWSGTEFEDGLMYETLEDQVRGVNRLIQASRRDRRT